jgi:predicted amidohydrolase
MKPFYQIAGIQMPVAFADVSANAARIVHDMQSLARENVDLAIFPECALTGYCFAERTAAWETALEQDSPALNELVACAQDVNIGIVVGFLERVGQQLYNSAALIDRQGWIGTYRKVHLPCLGVDRFTTPGDGFQLMEMSGLRVGVLICYDGSFPEATRVLALAGADLIALPTNWPSSSGCTPDVIPNCRALENHVYFAAINRIGVENDFEFVGKSRICAPSGQNLALANHDQETILRATIEPAIARNKHLVQVPGRHEIDRFADRRPQFYSTVCQPWNG